MRGWWEPRIWRDAAFRSWALERLLTLATLGGLLKSRRSLSTLRTALPQNLAAFIEVACKPHNFRTGQAAVQQLFNHQALAGNQFACSQPNSAVESMVTSSTTNTSPAAARGNSGVA